MGFFKALVKLGKATVGVALLPVDAAIDAVTLGGAITDSESKLVRRGRTIAGDIEDSYDETFGDD